MVPPPLPTRFFRVPLSLRQELLAFILTLWAIVGLALGASYGRFQRGQAALQILGSPLLHLSALVSALEQAVLEHGVVMQQVERRYWQGQRSQRAVEADGAAVGIEDPARAAETQATGVPTGSEVAPTGSDRSLAPSAMPPKIPTPVPSARPSPPDQFAAVLDLQPLVDHQQQMTDLLTGTLVLVDRQVPQPPLSAADVVWVEMAAQVRGLMADYRQLNDRSVTVAEFWAQAGGEPIPWERREAERWSRELDRDRDRLRQQLVALQGQLAQQRSIHQAQAQADLAPREQIVWLMGLGLAGWILGRWGLRLVFAIADLPAPDSSSAENRGTPP
ncbi:MAG: hypothetical protein ACO4CG_15015 [Prochlorothrix sp.]|nr:hypothetical protein [Prochlorothrix sp.]